MKPPRQESGFRRVVIDEQQAPGGPLSYVVRLYTEQGLLRTSRVHEDPQSAAREAFDWMDWSTRRPVDTTPLNPKRHQP